jgi:Helix-turn-helix domain
MNLRESRNPEKNERRSGAKEWTRTQGDSVLEPYVDADQAAAFLGTNRLKAIRMARCGLLPAHPLTGGKRRQWRFRLSELDKHMQGALNDAHPPVRQSKGD